MARPTHHKRHAAARCPDCKSRELEPSSEESKIEVDLQPTPQAIITRHVYVTCSCRKCGRTDISPSDDPAREAPACLGGAAREPEEQAMPKCVASGATPLTENPDAKNEPGKVGYGKGVRVETVRAFRERGTYRRIARELARFGIRPSHATIHSFLMATGMNMTKPTLAIMMALRMADILHIDETTFSLNGKKVWVWIFYDPATGNTLYAIRDSREHDVVKEVLGENWNNISVRRLAGIQILPHAALLGPHNYREPQHRAEESGLRRGRAGIRGAAKYLQDGHAGIRHEGATPGAS